MFTLLIVPNPANITNNTNAYIFVTLHILRTVKQVETSRGKWGGQTHTFVTFIVTKNKISFYKNFTEMIKFQFVNFLI